MQRPAASVRGCLILLTSGRKAHHSPGRTAVWTHVEKWAEWHTGWTMVDTEVHQPDLCLRKGLHHRSGAQVWRHRCGAQVWGCYGQCLWLAALSSLVPQWLSACNAGYAGSIPGLRRSPREGNGNWLVYSCLRNPMDRGVWWATVFGVSKSQAQLSTDAPTITNFSILDCSWGQGCHLFFCSDCPTIMPGLH